MKRLISIAFVILYMKCIAQDTIQKSIIVSSVFTSAGHGITLNYLTGNKNHSFEAGLRIHDNQPINDMSHYAFRHRLYARTFGQKLGVNLGYRRTLRINYSDLKPYAFYNVAGVKMRTRLPFERCVADTFFNDSTMQVVNRVETTIEDVGAIMAIENTIGVGVKVKAYKNFYLDAAIGAGVQLVFLPSSDAVKTKFKFYTLEPTDFYRIGISYRIDRVKAKRKV